MIGAAYRPVEDYAVIGNLETCTLIAPDGSIGCFPSFHVELPSRSTKSGQRP